MSKQPPTFLSDTDIRRYKTKGAEILEAAALKNSLEPALAELYTEIRDQLLGGQEMASQAVLDWADNGDVLAVAKKEQGRHVHDDRKGERAVSGTRMEGENGRGVDPVGTPAAVG